MINNVQYGSDCNTFVDDLSLLFFLFFFVTFVNNSVIMSFMILALSHLLV